MVNKKLREALLEKLGITLRALYYRAQKLQGSYSITTEDAIYVIAQQQGVILSNYLDEDILAHVRGVMQQITQTTQPTTIANLARQGKKGAEKKQTVIASPKEFTVTDPVLEKKKLLEAQDMGKIYLLLYVLENSIRKVIDLIMRSRYGNDWWTSKAPKGLRDAVEKRMADDERNSWHQRRGARPIDYLDLNQLPALVRKIEEEIVPNVIPDLPWFEHMIKEVYKSRCVVCHMNPLDKVNIKSVEVKFAQWEKQINEKKNLILGLST